MAELLQTEQTYVKDLEICIKFYFNALRNQSNEFKAQPGLVNKEDVLFSNMKDILDFHKEIFLKELQKYEAMPEDVGHCFVTWVSLGIRQSIIWHNYLFHRNNPSFSTFAVYGS